MRSNVTYDRIHIILHFHSTCYAGADEVRGMTGYPKLSARTHLQEVEIMQTLSEIPELVTCFPYNPRPRPQRDGKSTPHAPRQLVMELMEAGLRSPASDD